MMSPCASRTRRSTRRSTCKAAERSSGSWSPACAPGARCAFRGPAPASALDGHVTPEVMISHGPPRPTDRAVPGHWEGDLIIGTDRSAIGTLVERTTRFTMLLHLPRMRRLGCRAAGEERARAGRLRRCGDARRHRRQRSPVPDQLRRSLTWDRGKELAQHAQLKIDTGIAVYFADPHSPGSAARTRTLTGYCASTFQRAPTYPAGAPKTSKPSPPHSTAGHARHSAGRHPPRHSTNS